MERTEKVGWEEDWQELRRQAALEKQYEDQMKATRMDDGTCTSTTTTSKTRNRARQHAHGKQVEKEELLAKAEAKTVRPVSGSSESKPRESKPSRDTGKTLCRGHINQDGTSMPAARLEELPISKVGSITEPGNSNGGKHHLGLYPSGREEKASPGPKTKRKGYGGG